MSAERRPVYADSSALVKLVLVEPEREALEAYLGTEPRLATSAVAVVEVSRAAAVARPAGDVAAEVNRLLSSCLLVDVSAQLLRAARRLASRRLRTLDAIHLASALQVEAYELVAYDSRLLDAAAEHGMAVASPGR